MRYAPLTVALDQQHGEAGTHRNGKAGQLSVEVVEARHDDGIVDDHNRASLANGVGAAAWPL